MMMLMPIAHCLLSQRTISNDNNQNYYSYTTQLWLSSMTTETAKSGSVTQCKDCNGALDSKWLEMLDLLKQFRDVQGHTNVPHQYVTMPSLGSWCYHQRRKYHLSTLSDLKILRMEQLGFQWNPGLLKWDAKYRELVHYKERYGHCNVPHNDQNKALARWVSTQRRDFKKYMAQRESNSNMTNRFTALKKIGFIFDPNDAKWRRKFEELKKFRLDHGHCIVPMDNSPLANWVSQQRRQYRKVEEGKLEKNNISLERIKELNIIGFVWNARPDDSFYLSI